MREEGKCPPRPRWSVMEKDNGHILLQGMSGCRPKDTKAHFWFALCILLHRLLWVSSSCLQIGPVADFPVVLQSEQLQPH